MVVLGKVFDAKCSMSTIETPSILTLEVVSVKKSLIVIGKSGVPRKQNPGSIFGGSGSAFHYESPWKVCRTSGKREIFSGFHGVL